MLSIKILEFIYNYLLPKYDLDHIKFSQIPIHKIILQK